MTRRKVVDGEITLELETRPGAVDRGRILLGVLDEFDDGTVLRLHNGHAEELALDLLAAAGWDTRGALVGEALRRRR